MVYLGKDPVTYNVAGSFLRLRSSHNLMLIDGSDALDGPGKRRQDDHGHTRKTKQRVTPVGSANKVEKMRPTGMAQLHTAPF